MATLKELNDQVTALRLQLAVWESVEYHLQENYLSKDQRLAQKAIKVPDCLVELVPEEVINQIVSEIGTVYITSLRNKINELEGQPLTIGPVTNVEKKQ